LPAERAGSVPPKKRWVAWIAGAVVLVAVVLILANRDQAPEVQIVTVKRADLSASITSNGKVEPVAPFVAFAKYFTTVERVDVTAGQNVHRGQVILVLNADAPRLQLTKARADLLAAEEALRNAGAGGPPGEVAKIEGSLQQAKINLANLENNRKTLEQLVKEKAATEADLEQNKIQIAVAQASVKSLEEQKTAMASQARLNAQQALLAEQQARSEIATYENEVKSATVVSPIDGTLYSLPVYDGKYVDVGAPLAYIANLHDVRVRAFVDEPDLGVLATGEDVFITWDGLPGYVWTGKTEVVPKEVTKYNVRNVGEVLCSVQNTNMKLIPNLSVDVKIRWSDKKDVLVVPRGAVHTRGEEHFVFVLSDSTLRRRDVHLGIANPTVFEITSGLKEGERVALSGQITLRNGMIVNPVEARGE